MYLVLSDIHGNLSALDSTISNASKYDIDGVILLGDIIDYGMRSNEVISMLNSLEYNIIVNIWGNHEFAIVNGEFHRFSSKRGVDSAIFTKTSLTDSSLAYLCNSMSRVPVEFTLGDLYCLAVHGSISDIYWNSLTTENVSDLYSKYDVVFSGHSHYPHYFEQYYPADTPETRFKKKTIFINPGSVGQPRNINPYSQSTLFDSESGTIIHLCTAYDVESEQKLFTNDVDPFYRERLTYGV